MDTPPKPQPRGDTHARYTIESLRLSPESAMGGETWLILPEGFRTREAAKAYPLPTKIEELNRIALVPVPKSRQDGGCVYVRRVKARLRDKCFRQQSAVLEMSRRSESIGRSKNQFDQVVSAAKQETRQLVEEVRKEAAAAVASLTELFDLGRQGMAGQMKAHLENKKWHGEAINARAFRECFRMVSQTVKGLGLPSAQRPDARDAIVGEVAAALKATQETLALAPGIRDDEVKH